MKKRLSVKKILAVYEIHKVIKQGHTGNLLQFAKKMNLPKTTLARRLEELRNLNADIAFDPVYNSYYYRNNFEMEICITYE